MNAACCSLDTEWSVAGVKCADVCGSTQEGSRGGIVSCFPPPPDHRQVLVNAVRGTRPVSARAPWELTRAVAGRCARCAAD